MIELDGAAGEGGGQILRSALALSIVTGKAVRIRNIRARREKPGLLRQHLTAVQAAAKISGAEVDGARLRSQVITFCPGPVRAGEYRFDIGTAGSATLVLQTILLPLLAAEAPSRAVITGGTCNDKAPPYEFLARTFLPVLARMGADVRVNLVRHGFYPAGGGELAAEITPRKLGRLELVEIDPGRRVTAKILLAKLPRRIAEQELAVLERRLTLNERAIDEDDRGSGPGNAVFVAVESGSITEVATGFGARGISGTRVAMQAADEAERYLAAEVPVGEHLADQLLLPMALGEGGRFLTLPPTLHTRTNIEILKRFLSVPIAVSELGSKAEISVG